MGSYASLIINDLEICSSKSGVYPPELLALFVESEKFKEEIHAEESDGGTDYIMGYRTHAINVKNRLDILGYSISEFKRQFDNHLLALKDEIENCGEDFNEDIIKEYNLLSSQTIHDYIEMFKYVFGNSIGYWDIPESPLNPPLLNFAKDTKHYDEYDWGLPVEFFVLVRVMLECVNDTSMVILDLTDLIQGGYLEFEEELSRTYREAHLSTRNPFDRIIVITEGITDREVLRRSLTLLYPNLSGYLSFLDYDMKPTGGSGNIVHTIKSFAAAGVKNRIVALFDADTAAREAIASLKCITLPRNIKMLQFPDLDIFKNYPCVGTNGLEMQNIYGKACSIELYYGVDVLGSASGYNPVKWLNLSRTLEEWHGAIEDKNQLKERFFKKLNDCEKNPEMIKKTDWSGIQAILNALFQALH